MEIESGSCRSGAIQILDSMNAFLGFFVLDHSGYKSLYRTSYSDESASFPGFAMPVYLLQVAVSTFTKLPLAEGLSVPHLQLCGDRLPQERQAELFLWAGDQ